MTFQNWFYKGMHLVQVSTNPHYPTANSSNSYAYTSCPFMSLLYFIRYFTAFLL